jgi:hypothetical protein
MTKSEQNCTNTADVCELAHRRTVQAIRKLNASRVRKYKIDCESVKDCGDKNQQHAPDQNGEYEEGTHYGSKAQQIFNAHYDHICEVTGI